MAAPIVQGCIGVRLQDLPSWLTKFKFLPLYLLYLFWLLMLVLCGAFGPEVFDFSISGCGANRQGWCTANYDSSGSNNDSFTVASQLTRVKASHQMLHSKLQFQCDSFAHHKAEVSHIDYKVWLCSGDGNWTNGAVMLDSPTCGGSWISQGVQKQRAVSC